MLRIAADLLFPFLLLLGAYLILHGHLTPGGGFQGGTVLAVAYFLPLLASPAAAVSERVTTWLKREVTFTLPNWVLVLAAVLVLALVFD